MHPPEVDTTEGPSKKGLSTNDCRTWDRTDSSGTKDHITNVPSIGIRVY